MSTQTYTKELLSSIYDLARNYYVSGFFNEAEKLCEGLLAIHQTATPARLMLASVHFEKGNFSLAANHFRLAAQDKNASIHAKLGILASYCGLKDFARASSLAAELQAEISSAEEEHKLFYELYRKTIEKAVNT